MLWDHIPSWGQTPKQHGLGAETLQAARSCCLRTGGARTLPDHGAGWARLVLCPAPCLSAPFSAEPSPDGAAQHPATTSGGTGSLPELTLREDALWGGKKCEASFYSA